MTQFIFEATLNPSHVEHNDGDLNLAYDIADDRHERLWMRIQSSLDEETLPPGAINLYPLHHELLALMGKKVRITLAVVEEDEGGAMPNTDRTLENAANTIAAALRESELFTGVEMTHSTDQSVAYRVHGSLADNPEARFVVDLTIS